MNNALIHVISAKKRERRRQFLPEGSQIGGESWGVVRAKNG